MLEALHPGAGRRISTQAERLEQQLETETELLELALGALQPEGARNRLQRKRLGSLTAASQRRLLHHWLSGWLGREPGRPHARNPRRRLRSGGEPGRLDLPGGWQLHWDRSTLWVRSPEEVHG